MFGVFHAPIALSRFKTVPRRSSPPSFVTRPCRRFRASLPTPQQAGPRRHASSDGSGSAPLLLQRRDLSRVVQFVLRRVDRCRRIASRRDLPTLSARRHTASRPRKLPRHAVLGVASGVRLRLRETAQFLDLEALLGQLGSHLLPFALSLRQKAVRRQSTCGRCQIIHNMLIFAQRLPSADYM